MKKEIKAKSSAKKQVKVTAKKTVKSPAKKTVKSPAKKKVKAAAKKAAISPAKKKKKPSAKPTAITPPRKKAKTKVAAKQKVKRPVAKKIKTAAKEHAERSAGKKAIKFVRQRINKPVTREGQQPVTVPVPVEPVIQTEGFHSPEGKGGMHPVTTLEAHQIEKGFQHHEDVAFQQENKKVQEARSSRKNLKRTYRMSGQR